MSADVSLRRLDFAATRLNDIDLFKHVNYNEQRRGSYLTLGSYTDLV